MKRLLLLLFLIPNLVMGEEFKMPKLPIDISCWSKDLDNKGIELCNQRIFIDVDFDGKKEVVERNFRDGQRHRDTFTIYKHLGLEQPGNQLVIMDYPPYNSVDSYTVFNSTNKTISTNSSGGACSSTFFTYKNINNDWLISKKVEYNLGKGSDCFKSTYEINDNLELVLIGKELLKK